MYKICQNALIANYNDNRLGSVALVDLQSFKSILVLAAQKYHQSGKHNLLPLS